MAVRNWTSMSPGEKNGPKIDATLPYWNKVKAVLQQRGFNL